MLPEPQVEPELDDPISPELILVAAPEDVRAARLCLPDPEPLDEWLRRVRWEETERALRVLMAEAQAKEQWAEEYRGGVGALAFAAVFAILSVLPVIVLVLAG
jgi:hypothetical protein